MQTETNEYDIGSIVRDMESKYISGGGTQVSKYVHKDMYEDICRIEAYLNSKHTTGPEDSLGRDKPFFNIVTAASNIWYRATVIPLHKIKLRAVKSKDTIDSFLANVHLQDWMRREKFGAFITEWGRVLARYGSAVSKFVEKDGKLIPINVPWNRLIVDAIDFDNNPKIEVIELTEQQLYQNESYDKEVVEALCDAQTTRKTLDNTNKDDKTGYIKLYEVHGKFPLSCLTDKESDDDTYVQQMHVVSFVASGNRGEYDNFTLYKGKESKDPYHLAHLIKEDGQTLAIGAVQHLFEAQWMLNHSVKAIKDQLDLASKLIFQTSDATFVGQNALTAIETGDILIHSTNQPLTQVANTSHDVSALQSFGNQWKVLSNEITGISESMLGNTAPSGTAWRQVDAILQQNLSLFELMRSNKGLYIEEMMRIHVIPHLKKKMDTSEEVSATLDMYDIDKIDSIYIKNMSIAESNRIIKDKVLSGQAVTPEEQAIITQSIQGKMKEDLKQLGNTRYFKPSDVSTVTWKEQFKDLEWELEVDTKDESTNSDAVTTLNTLLMTIGKNPGVLQDPNMRLIVNKILMITGQVSPLELSAVNASTPVPSPMQPQQTPQPTPAGA